MALDIEPTRAPRRYTELQRLVQAVREALPADESDALEWKSTLDLGSHHGRVHIARAILGFANRMPEAASRTFEGHAFVLVGVSPGELQGVTMIDLAQLEQGVLPFLLEDGPRWQAQWVEIDGKHVLVVDVDAPRWGDPPFHARKSGDGIQDGQTFVRGMAETKPATSAQLRALEQRLLRGVERAGLDIAVSITSPAELTPLNRNSDAWIAAERERLMVPLRKDRNWSGFKATPNFPHVASLETSLASMVANVGMTKAEDRTEAEYLEQIDSYLKGCEAHYPRVLDLFAANTLQPLVLNVTNNTAWNLPALVVELYVPGEVDGISPKRPAIDATDKFPAAPRSWGPRRSPMFDTYSDIGRTYPAMPASRGDRRPGPQIENGGSVRIKFPPHDLRPHAKIDLDPVVLLVDAPPGSTVTASWSATSTGVDGEVAGEVMLPVASQAMTLPHGKAQAGG